MLEHTELVYVFTVTDPNTLDTVSVEALSLPPGMNLNQLTATTWELRGNPGPAAPTYTMILRATDDGAPNLQTTVTLRIAVEPYQRSDLFGQLVITEVLYGQSGGIDEFIEIRNLGPSPVPLAGLRIVDANLRVDGWDPDPPNVPFSTPAWDLDGTIGGQDLDGNNSVLNQNERAVLWVRYDSISGFPGRTPAKLHYSLQNEFLALPALDNGGDDVWILEQDERSVVAYVAWGDSNSFELGTPPPDTLDIWEPSNQPNLNDQNNIRDGESIALATDGPGSQFSHCWEENGTGLASQGNCPEATGTTKDKDSDPDNRDSSAGKSNL